MTTIGRVKQIRGNEAVVSVVRTGACGGDCGSCGGCEGRTVDVRAFCDIDVQVGTVVELSSRSGYIYLGMIIVFLLPVLLPLLGYFIFAGINITAAYTAAVTLFVLSVIVILRLSKSKKFLKNSAPSVTRAMNKK